MCIRDRNEELETLRHQPWEALRERINAVTGLPLLVSDKVDYASMIETVVAVRRSRGID